MHRKTELWRNHLRQRRNRREIAALGGFARHFGGTPIMLPSGETREENGKQTCAVDFTGEKGCCTKHAFPKPRGKLGL